MIKNYLKTAFRNLVKNKMHSALNITGLSAGMAVAMLIGLWMWDELSFDKYHKNYNSIAQVMMSQTINSEVGSQVQLPMPMGNTLRTNYGSYFKRVIMSSQNENHILSVGDKKFTETGNYMQPDGPELFTLNMLAGSRNGLQDPSTVLLSQSVATALFGGTDIIGKVVKFDGETDYKVSGVYEDLPANTTLNKILFIAPWERTSGLKQNIDNWGNNNWLVFVQLANNTDMDAVSAKIKYAEVNKANTGSERFKPVTFLQPMSKWHLYSEFKNGVNVGGRIQYVRLFTIIGFFVLLLACINFMNLSTARSEKRAKEVGIRKAIGSLRSQLVYQFFTESILMVAGAFIFSLALVLLMLPFFNEVAGKNIGILWGNAWFWLISIGFSLVTALIAGSYPAFYLSSFRPVKVLKGAFKAGRFAAVPRKVLVVLQFSVSVVLIISTIIVFRQVQFAKNRPVGYSRDNLLTAEVIKPDIQKHFDAFRADLIKTGAVTEVASSSAPVTETRNEEGNFDWEGRDKSNNNQNFYTIGVSQTYGKTIGWQFVAGRDYRSGTGGTDGFGYVINESALKLFGFKDPFNKVIHWYGYDFHIIGVVKDMVMQSPFDPTVPTIFYMAPWPVHVFTMRVNPNVSAETAVSKIEAVFKKYSPAEPFNYKFADDEYERKFAVEERVGKLATFFAVLAIFISCLGLFGMASFMAEQRVKEIGVRRVLGATVLNVWGLLSKDFVLLVVISLIISIPLAYLFMHNWLQSYTYRTGIAWWIFAAASAGALTITLLTVSYQGIKAALANPVKSLRSE